MQAASIARLSDRRQDAEFPSLLLTRLSPRAARARAREQWCEEICLTIKQLRRAVGVLVAMGLISTTVKRFKGVPTLHIRLNPSELATRLELSLRRRVAPVEAGSGIAGEFFEL